MVFLFSKSHGSVQCVFWGGNHTVRCGAVIIFKSIRCGAVRCGLHFSNIIRCGGVRLSVEQLFPTVRCGAVLLEAKSYGAVRFE